MIGRLHAVPMNKMAVLVAAVVVAAAAALLSSHDDDSCRDVAVLEIGGGGDAAAGRRVELVPVDAAGPESLAFDGAGGGPYAGVSDGRVLRWVPGERRWEEHSSSCAPELYVLPVVPPLTFWSPNECSRSLCNPVLSSCLRSARSVPSWAAGLSCRWLVAPKRTASS